jgi:hypothetical protein
LIVGPQIEMHSVLGALVVAGRHQAESPARPVWRYEQMSSRRSGPDVLKVGRLTPEGRHQVEVNAIDEDTVKAERHRGN